LYIQCTHPQSLPWRLIRRRAAAAGIAAPIGCHTFRAHRNQERLTQDEVEQIRL
jgi:hypothetical protein